MLAAMLAAGALLPALPAAAQATLTAEAGLERWYKGSDWVPLLVTLTNQGAPARVEVRARFSAGPDNPGEYRLPERELRSSANEQHTLYLKAPMTYTTQALIVDLYRDGRLINTVRPSLNLVGDSDWLAVSIGGGQALMPLTSGPVTLPRRRAGPRTFGGAPRVVVASLVPTQVPDRWQGLRMADLVLLSGVTERDFTPEQLAALRDYVVSGGTLAVTGGVNANRLATPFFTDLLPVRVQGTRTLAALPALGDFAGAAVPTGSHPIALATPRRGARTLLRQGTAPLVVSGRKGSGEVVFIAFDPALAPLNLWNGGSGFWQRLMRREGSIRVVPAVSDADVEDPRSRYNYGYSANQPRLASAPFAISQLDIPAFYVVALFLLAYIVVLVPVNYFVLKARDKKEYAWLTTPAIVAVFSVGAYMIGYGYKGGRTLMVKVGLVEARLGQDAAPNLVYAGLFSPKKTTYTIEPAARDSLSRADAASLLLCEPTSYQSGPGLRVVGGDAPRVEEFAVDMWAMRVVKSEGISRLDKGFEARLSERGGHLTGRVRNGSPYTLEGCRLVTPAGVTRLPALGPGQEIQVDAPAGRNLASGSLLPISLLDDLEGDREQRRIRRAVLQPLCAAAVGGRTGNRPITYPLLIGWIREPVAPLRVNGQDARERAATLLLLHLDGSG